MGHGVCVHGQGFWRHHPEDWPVEKITVGGVLYSKVEAIRVMNTPGGGDKTYDLFRQLTATMVNLFCGCNPECIEETMNCADAWLCSHPVGSGVPASSQAWKHANVWCRLLEKYNEGLLCEESCNSPPVPPRRISGECIPQSNILSLAVWVSDVDYDELTVRFYDAYRHTLLGECSRVESDSNVSVALEWVSLNESLRWYVVVSDQYAETRSSTWVVLPEVNGIASVDEEVSPSLDPLDVCDLSPLMVRANGMYTFQVQVGNISIVPDLMVVYWYNETRQDHLLLVHHEEGWNASMDIEPRATRFWYRLYVAYEPGCWSPLQEREVSVVAGGDGL